MIKTKERLFQSSLKVILILLILNSFFNLSLAQGLREEAKKHYEKGSAYYEQAKFKEAQEEFEKALVLASQEEKKPTTPQEEKTNPQTPKIKEYTIGDEDTLFISVWQDRALDQEVAVQPDGRISFSLAGEIPVLGLTTTQLKEELTKRLAEYIKNPLVSVSLKKIGGRKVILLGQVPKQGVYQLTGKRTLLELIAMAGGFSSDAVLSSVIVIRGGFQNPRGMRLNLTRAIDKADTINQNIILEPEDIIYIPKKFIANVSYFVSQVIGPIAQGRLTVEDIMWGKGSR